MLSRPALSRTIDRGNRMRATAMARIQLNGSTGGRSASGVPSTGTKALIGTLSGCGRNSDKVWSSLIRSVSLSPSPMMPPLQTLIPASETV